MDEGAPTLYTTDDTGNYVEYTPPEPPQFHETLPEEIRDNEHLKEVKDGAELARYYVDLKSNYLAPPDNPDGYEFEPPDGFEIDNEIFGKFKSIAFENGVNQKQFSELMNLEVQRNEAAKAEIQKRIETAQKEAETALKTEWGDKYEAKIEAAKQTLRHPSIADESFSQFLEETRFGDNPHVIKMFAKLADLISEDAFQKPGQGSKEKNRQVGEDGRLILHFPSMEK
jgi:hypothetical protein